LDISKRITQPEKKALANLSMEIHVLSNILNERKSMFQELANRIAKGAVPNPDKYIFKFDADKDIWELMLKPEVLTLSSNNQVRRN
jgi:hypothetical protein